MKTKLKLTKNSFVFFALLLVSFTMLSQELKSQDWRSLGSVGGVQFYYKVRTGLAVSVDWKLVNNNDYKVDVEFDKEISANGTVRLNNHAHVYIDAGKTLSGTTFSGDLDLSDDLFYGEDIGKDEYISYVKAKNIDVRQSR